MKSFLDRLGIYGYSIAHERALLASILTGTPILLIGHIGEAKTKAAEMFAALLNEPFQKIAADKVQFEDMIGFPNPKSLGEGEVDYVRTKLSIWDKRFILIDEISRCNPQMQNKFLELVLDRQIMGLPTDVKWVWSTMNPLDYPGSQPLDEALAGRMGYVLSIERIINSAKNEDILVKVVSSRNNAQTPALSHWTDASRSYQTSVPEALREELQDLMYKAGNIFTGIEDNWSSSISKYVASFCTALKGNSALFIDGRRMVMIKNNVIANIAIQTIWGGKALSVPELKQLCQEVIPLSIPWIATGVSGNFDVSKFRQACKLAEGQLDAADSLFYKILTEQDPIRKAELFLKNRDKIDSSSAVNMLAPIFEPVRSLPEEKTHHEAIQFFLRVALTKLFLQLDNVPAEAISLAARNYPINMEGGRVSKEDAKFVTLKLASSDDYQEFTNTYKKLLDSTKPSDWAVGYFVFYGSKETIDIEQLRERINKAYDALHIITNAFATYAGHNIPANITAPATSADSIVASALSEILKDSLATEANT